MKNLFFSEVFSIGVGMQVCAHKCGGFIAFIAYVLHFVSKLKSFVQTTVTVKYFQGTIYFFMELH